MTPKTIYTEQNTSIEPTPGDERLSMPMPAFVLIPLSVALLVDAAALAAVVLVWPSHAVSGALGAAGISVNAVAGFYHDHPFVPADRAEEAVRVLARLRDAAE